MRPESPKITTLTLLEEEVEVDVVEEEVVEEAKLDEEAGAVADAHLESLEHS